MYVCIHLFIYILVLAAFFFFFFISKIILNGIHVQSLLFPGEKRREESKEQSSQ